MQKEIIYAEIVDGDRWAEVDDPNDLHVAQYTFNNERREILEYGFGGYWNYDLVDFCFIRNMYFPNSAIISELRNNLPDLLHNYGSRQEILNRKLAWLLLCKESNVIALNGASQLYPFLQSHFDGQPALIPSPGFGEYNRIFPSAQTYDDRIGIHVQQIENLADKARVVVFVNPNNPTGSTLDTQWIYSFAQHRPETMVLVDESFIEFSGQPSILDRLEKEPLTNCIVLKSLSKSLGVPGVRLGYVYSCNREIISTITRSIPIWNMNSFAEYFLEVILKHRNALKQSIADTIRDRSDFALQLAKCSLVEKVYPSGANFLLVKVNAKAGALDLVDFLLSNYSIYVKDVSSKINDGSRYLRLAVRLPEENSRLIECLQAFADRIDLST